ncbi:protein PSK SIMULATOR 1-like [Rutidosis leptorrhynchoides]|uniref:protein PSK SIMULATOR 1-like n=1 Tax=Rutidosis leptorrhynchoides TaxID=125765 RepID=UPI003A99E200
MKDSSWFPTMFPHKNKGLELEDPVIGIVSFEATRMMCKVVNIWNCLTDRQMSLLKEELRYSLGIRTLISDDHNYLMDLVLEEIVDNLKCVAISVARLGKKCVDPVYHHLDHVFDNPFEIDLKWCGWEYRLKKMEKRVKKMKRFATIMLQLHDDLDRLSAQEIRLTKMQYNGVNKGQLHEFHQKVMWLREEVSGLREMSPWVRTYDYVVRLLLRSLFTIVERIKVVFGITTGIRASGIRDLNEGGCFVGKNSMCTVARASVYPSDRSSKRPISKNGYTPALCGRYPYPYPSNKLASRNDPRVRIFQNDNYGPTKKGNFTVNAKKRMVSFQEPTLGSACLALRYANIILFIENLAMSPRFMSSVAREDLYDMLTTNVKLSLREKLFLSKKEKDLLAYDESIASDRKSSFQRILDWLSPLAHNMIKWYSERSFEKQPMGSGANVLLVQTLYYADQATSEIAITELIVGLHYVCKYSQEVIDKSFMGCSIF